MSAKPLGAATCSWLGAAYPATRAHRYTTTPRHFKVERESLVVSEKAGASQLRSHCGCRLPSSGTLFRSSCDVFS